ncbi:hypothetical protein H8356DRAFT_348281 [Neocallimastix lanati (nom. inval.)]|nr:hypothetical protein H8356DRAFT_348281 [Neocallimastix sp. JGI-2020a]
MNAYLCFILIYYLLFKSDWIIFIECKLVWQNLLMKVSLSKGIYITNFYNCIHTLINYNLKKNLINY